MTITNEKLVKLQQAMPNNFEGQWNITNLHWHRGTLELGEEIPEEAAKYITELAEKYLPELLND